MDYMMTSTKDNLGNELELRKHGRTYAVGYIGSGSTVAWREFDNLDEALYVYDDMVDTMARGLFDDDARCKMLKEL